MDLDRQHRRIDIVLGAEWLGTHVVLTTHLLTVSGVIAMLSGIQFAVALRSEPSDDLELA